MSTNQILQFPSEAFSLEAVKQAAKRIEPYAHRTPVVTSETFNELTGHQVFFKCENQQKTGAFKFRGAVNALSQLTQEELERGVVTHSSGNHAQALAAAAKIFETTAHIVMPSDAPVVKKAAVEAYGGLIQECEPTLASRTENADRIQKETGATMVPPFNHPHIIAGQGTCALEFLQQVPNLNLIIAPVGGGGLLSGTCITGKGISRRLTIVAAEPKGADDAYRSKESGELQPQLNPQTIADGLKTSLGDLTWPFVRGNYVERVVTVSEKEIIDAMKLFMEREKQVIEPSAAVAIAALLSPKMVQFDYPQNIGVILSGGNVDLTRLPF